MRKVVQFQATSTVVWALDDEGNLWRRSIPRGGATEAGDWWEFVEGPPDGEPGSKAGAEDWVGKLERQIRRETGNQSTD